MAFVNAAKKKDFFPGQCVGVTLEGRNLAVSNIDGQYYAIENECTHAGGPLCEGSIEGEVVTCPWHGATFNLKTGEALSAPAFDAVKSYKTSVVADDIQIELS